VVALDRILPNVDMEGAALERDHPGVRTDTVQVVAAADDAEAR